VRRSKGAWLATVSQRVAWRYAIALIAFLISFFVRDLLNNWLIGISDRGLIIFLPAILLVAFFVGLGPAILTGLLSAFAVWYFFLPPYHTFAIGIDGAFVLATFVVGSGIGVALVQWLRIAITERKQAEALIAADLYNMTLLNQLSNRLVRERSNFDRNLNTVVDTAIAITSADKGNLQLLDPSTGVLTIAAQRGFEDPFFLSFFASVRDDASACAAAMQSGQRVIVHDVRESEIFGGQPSKDVLLDAGVCAVTSTPLMASSGKLLGMISTHFVTPHRPSERELHFVNLLARQTADYLEGKRADEIQATLTREIEHRSNNLLSVIQTIASRSLSGRKGYTLAKAKKAFEARLHALARTNQQLTKSNWSGVNLSEIVRSELQPYAERTIVDGIDVILSPQHAQNFTLTLHELATNAAKYGALSNGSGKIAVYWTITGPSKNNKLRFKWQERGGPPVVVPTQHGFGTTLIKATFPDVQIDYAVEGLSCEIAIPFGQNQRDQMAIELGSANLARRATDQV
jgi:two-component sensor histidine kinase